MMKKAIILLLLLPLFCISAKAVENKLYICFAKTTYLIYSAPILEYKIGTREVQIHSTMVGDRVLSIQLKSPSERFTETNLFVLLTDGRVFYYDVLKNDTLDDYVFQESTYIGGMQQALSNEQIGLTGQIVIPSGVPATQMPDFTAEYNEMLSFGSTFLNSSQTKQQVRLSLDAIGYKDDHLFFKFKITNNNAIDYDIEYIKFMRKMNNRGQQQSYQETEVPVIAYKPYPEKLVKSQDNVFVFAIQKLTLLQNEIISLEIKERSGERDFAYIITTDFISYAKKLTSNK